MSVLRASTRPTRRDVLKHPLRSLAAILLIAIPVALVCIGLVYSSSQSAANFLNNPRTSATFIGGSCEQSIDGYNANCDNSEPSGLSEFELLRAHLPEGFHAELTVSGTARVSFGENSESIPFAQITDELAPAEGHIALPERILNNLGAEIGDVLQVEGGGQVTISGITPSGTALLAEPTLVDPVDYSSIDDGADNSYWGTWSIVGPEAFTWDDVRALNAEGFTVTSQDVIENPPPADEVTLDNGMNFPPDYSNYVFIFLSIIPLIIVAFLALMLISPVFTISVSRQTRNFALLASQGATPRNIRWAVLVYGLFAGVIGAVLGSFVGIVGTSIWWVSRYSDWPLALPWEWLLLTPIVAVLGSTMAAFLPAFIAGRSSIISGIHGGAADRIMRWKRWMAIGPASLAVLAVLFGVLHLTSSTSAVVYRDDQYYVPWREILQSLGSLFTVIAVAASAPAVVWILGHLKGTLAVRLASRDLLRQSMRSIPAIAALAAVIFVATNMSVTDRAQSNRNLAAAESVYPVGTALLAPQDGIAEDMDAAVAQVETVVGRTQRVDIYGSQMDRTWLSFSTENENSDQMDWVPTLNSSLNAALSIASPELIELFGAGTADLSGSAALVNSTDEADTAREYTLWEYNDLNMEQEELASVELETRPVLPVLFGDVLLTQGAFDQLGLDREFMGSVLVAEDRISAEQQRQLSELINTSTGVTIKFPAWTWNTKKDTMIAAAVLTGLVVAVMALVLALSSQQIRRQKVVLDAIGAPPNLTRQSNALFGALGALGASVLGLLAGHLAALPAATRTMRSEEGEILYYGSLGFIEPNWLFLLGLLIIAPAVTAAIGWAFTPKVELSEYRD